jgi:hypothetical protein
MKIFSFHLKISISPFFNPKNNKSLKTQKDWINSFELTLIMEGRTQRQEVTYPYHSILSHMNLEMRERDEQFGV